MRAILTRQNSDDTFDSAGMNNRLLTGDYKTLRNLVKYGIPEHYKNRGAGALRIEIFNGSIHGKPIETFYY